MKEKESFFRRNFVTKVTDEYEYCLPCYLLVLAIVCGLMGMLLVAG